MNLLPLIVHHSSRLSVLGEFQDLLNLLLTTYIVCGASQNRKIKVYSVLSSNYLYYHTRTDTHTDEHIEVNKDI